jgi:hypothetical protein
MKNEPVDHLVLLVELRALVSGCLPELDRVLIAALVERSFDIRGRRM